MKTNNRAHPKHAERLPSSGQPSILLVHLGQGPVVLEIVNLVFSALDCTSHGGEVGRGEHRVDARLVRDGAEALDLGDEVLDEGLAERVVL